MIKNSSDVESKLGDRALPPAPLPADQTGLVGNINDRHFRTDHLLANLKQRTISSGAITLFSQAVKFVLTVGSTMVLARLLSPRDFGLVAMVGTVTAFLRVFKDAGLSAATVQRESITHAQVSNLFWINLGISAFMAALVACLSPLIAWFYKEPKLVGLTLALSTTFLLSGSTIQHAALLNRQMRFKAIAVIEVGSMTIAVLVGVIMAFLGCGYWSLVGLSVAQETAGIVLTWSVSRWRPQLPVRRSGTRSLLNFGANLTGASLVRCLTQNMDSLLIGRFYGADAVGLYSRAMALLMRPLNQLLNPITSVFEPTLARLQHEPERYRRTFLQAYDATALAGFVGAGLMLPLSHPITIVLLGPKWEKTSIIFAGFTFAALFAPLANTTGWLYISQGRGKDSLIVSMVCGITALFGICIGLPFGAAGVAISWSLSGLLVGLPYVYYNVGRQGPVHTRDLWLGFVKHLPVWAAVFGSATVMCFLTSNLTSALQLLIAVPISLSVGAATIYFWKYSRETAAHIVKTISESIQQRKRKLV